MKQKPPAAPPSRPDRLVLLLIGAVVFSAASSIALAEWMPRLDLLGNTVIASLLLGTLIATRPWRGRVAHVVMLLYGVVWTCLIVLDQMPDKVYGWTSLDTLRHMIVRLGEHIYIWLQAVSTGGVGRDNTIFLMFLTAIFWLIGYGAAWNTFRQRHMWRAVAPAGVALLINTYYYGGSQPLWPLLIVYLFSVLLYAARMYALSQKQRWQLGRIRYSPEIQRDFLQTGSSIALAAILFGAVAPSVLGAPQIVDLWREMSRPLRSLEESFNRMFSGLEPHGTPFVNPFGRTLALLGQRNLGDQLVMEVQSPEPHYWQAVSFDEYDGGAWQSSDATRLTLAPTDKPLIGDFQARELITETFSVYFPNSTLIFAAPQPVAINRPVWVETYPGSPNVETTFWSALEPLGNGESYTVVSSVSDASVEHLQSAGTNYPQSIRDRYLQLPKSLPERVRQKAQQIVADAKATNPYDQASALEAWLRANIKYNEKIAGPEPGQDAVDYVLFDARQAYCDYYASAMAVMARSLGIPARVATGYASGTYDTERHAYEVHQFDAHTWVEVYFPQYGWVQFEPTASRPVIDRPLPGGANGDGANGNNALGQRDLPLGRDPRDLEFGPEGQAPNSPQNPLAPGAAAQAALSPWVFIAAGALLLLLIAALSAMWLFENRGMTRQLRSSDWAFAHMTRMATWLRVHLSPAQTPYEQAAALTVAMPRSEPTINQLATSYVRERYGRSASDPLEVRSLWRRLHWRMWWSGIKRRIPRSIRMPRLKARRS